MNLGARRLSSFCSEKKREFKLRHLADERTLTQKITKKLRQKLDFIKFS
jgi:hypothetical protein